MQKLFLPYELAVIAKQKGFNEPCFACYNSVKKFIPIDTFGSIEGDLVKNTELNSNNQFCTAPLYQQVTEWLFKEYGVFIDIKRIKVMADPDDDLHVYYCELDDGFSSDHFKTPAQALKKGIEEALKRIP